MKETKLLKLIIILKIISIFISKEVNEEEIKKIKTKVKSMKYKNNTIALQINANSPCEDRYFIQEIDLPDLKGLLLSVFDGHGGQMVAEYANQTVYKYFIESFTKTENNINLDKRINDSLIETYKKIEEDILTDFAGNHKADRKVIRQGSCALTAIVLKDKVYVANLGDSKAKMFYLSEYNKTINYKSKKLMQTFNAGTKKEKERLRLKWPKESDIIKCKRNLRTCYVKGALAPTRSLGDFYLKYEEFSELLLSKKYYFKEGFNGPYIDNEPDVKIFNITKNDKYIILATDGLWDYLKKFQANNLMNELYKNNITDIETISYRFMHFSLKASSSIHSIKFDEMLNMTDHKKLRKIHDDITIILYKI